MIPLCEPNVNIGNSKKYINECIETNWVSSSGEFVNNFEKMLANYLGVEYVVAVSSGTAALHLSLLAGNILPNQEVIVPAMSFIATANAVRYIGAYPVFIDCDLTYCHIDLDKLKDFICNHCVLIDNELYNMHTNRCVKAIIPVHLFGHPIPYMKELVSFVREFNLVVIEDAAQALGSVPVGKYSDMCCFSFNGNKIITCGGGGAIATNNKTVAGYVRHLSTQARSDAVEYIHDKIGFNYRLSNLHAALGCAQLEQLDSFVLKKRRLAYIYAKRLVSPHFRILGEHLDVYSNFWLSVLFIEDVDAQRRLYSSLKQNNIGVSPLWYPLPWLPMFSDCQSFGVRNAYHNYRRGILLPSSVELTDEDQSKVCDIICRNIGATNV